MKQISKNNIDTTSVNAYAYLHPHPLDIETNGDFEVDEICLLYTSPSPRD